LEIVEDVFAGYRENLAVLPTGSYKTTTFGGLALYHAHWTEDAAVAIGAASREQAEIMFRQAAGFVRRSQDMLQRFKVQSGYRRILGIGFCEGSVIQVYSSDANTGDGIIPTLALIDELHRHKGSDLYGTWLPKLTKRQGQMVTLSTAGDSEDNPLEELRDAAKRMKDAEVVIEGRHTIVRAHNKGFVMHEWALGPDDDSTDLEVVKMANPAEQVTLAELEMRFNSPSNKDWEWERYTCNRRAKGENSAIQPREWDEHKQDDLVLADLADLQTWIGMDLGWKIDHSALVPVGFRNAKERLIAGAVTLAPPVDEWELVAHLLRLVEALPGLRAVVYDPNAGGEQLVQQLDKRQHPLQTDDEARETVGLPALRESRVEPILFVEHSQDNAPMSMAAIRFDEALRSDFIKHDGMAKCSSPGCRCQGMRGHILNAVVRPLGEKWKYDRPNEAKGAKRLRHPIDALTGACIANSTGVEDFGNRLDISQYRITQ